MAWHPAEASPSYDHLLAMQGEDAIFTETESDVVLARVAAVKGGRTKGHPPWLDLEVLEVLRGAPRVDRHRALWEPFPSDIDWEGGNSDSLTARWEREAMTPPSIGDSLILAGVMSTDSTGLYFRTSPVGRFKFDALRYRWATEAIRSVPRLNAERLEYANAWNRRFKREELLEGARPVLPGTPLAVGEPVLIRTALVWQGRVVRVNPDGKVVVRVEGRDSRSDWSVKRDVLSLYPERLLQEQRPRTSN